MAKFDPKFDDLLSDVEDDLSDGERSAVIALINAVKVLRRDENAQVRREAVSIASGVRSLLARVRDRRRFAS